MYSQSQVVEQLQQEELKEAKLKLDEEVEIVGLKADGQKTIVTGIEMFRKLLR